MLALIAGRQKRLRMHSMMQQRMLLPVTRDYFDVNLKAEIESAKADIIKWVAGLLFAQAAVVATMVKLLG